MLLYCVRAYQAGIPLPRDELRLAVPKYGLLMITDWRDGNRARRALRVANLYVHDWSQPRA